MKYSVLALAVMCFTGCKAKAPDISSDDPVLDISHQAEHDNTEHKHVLEKKGAIKPPKIKKLVRSQDNRPFDAFDKTTWGDVTETLSDGTPIQYTRILPDGNIRILSFHHRPQEAHFPHGYKYSKKYGADSASTVLGSEYLHWNRRKVAATPDGDKTNTVPVVILDATIDPHFSGFLRDAVNRWNKSPVIKLQIAHLTGADGMPDAKQKLCTAKRNEKMKGHILACDYDFSTNPEMNPDNGGYAMVEATPDGHIYSAVVHFNTAFEKFDPKKEEVAGYARKNKEFVVCHELGHAVGVGHAFFQENRDISLESCMDYANNPTDNLKPDHYDYETLLAVYGHSHDDYSKTAKYGPIMGWTCTRTKSWGKEQDFVQRVYFNNAEAIATTKIKTSNDPNKQSHSRSVEVYVQGSPHYSYSWNLSNSNRMRPHKKGKSGEFPELGGHFVNVTIMNISMGMNDFAGQSMLMDARGDQIETTEGLKLTLGKTDDETCEVLWDDRLQDVSHFLPPKNKSATGSYKVNEIAKDGQGKHITKDGKFVILDDYELHYEYKIKEITQAGMNHPSRNDLIDPIIEPILQ